VTSVRLAGTEPPAASGRFTAVISEPPTTGIGRLQRYGE
jgi:hypothetical protein